MDSTDGFDLSEIAAGLGIKTAAVEDEKKPDEPEADATAESNEDTETIEETDKLDEKDEESEETAEEESEGEDAEEPEGKAEESSKVQRRIDRLTAEKHTLRDERDTLKAEIEDLRKQVDAKPTVVTVDGENPLSSITDMKQLDAEVGRAQAVLDWADDHAEGGSVTVAGEEKFYDADAVKQIRHNCRSVLRAAPKQQNYLRLRETAVQEAKVFYPDLYKAGTAAKQFLDASVAEYPSLMRVPTLELWIGDALVGQQMRLAKFEQMQRKQSEDKAKKSSAAKEVERIPKSPTPSASPKVSGKSESLSRKAAAVFKSPGSTEALESYMEELV